MRKLYYILLLFFISCNVKYEKVTKVIDGDSFYTSSGEVRIWGADCPEATRGHIQPFGFAATNFTRQLIEGKTVKLIQKDRDKYNRMVCKVILANGSDLSQILIKAGLAFTYDRFSPQSYCNEERKAKFNHVGLWIQNNPESPYQFRKYHK